MSKKNKNTLVPKLRFPEFTNEKWREVTLSQVADYENGKAHEQDIADLGDFIVVNSKFISQEGDVKKFSNTAFCPTTIGDILMVLSDVPNGKAIAKCFLVEEDNRYTVNQRICRITPRNINSKILYYLLNRNPYFLAFDDGVKQTNLRKEDVLNCFLLIPSNLKEQQKIAACLSSLDEVITAENQKLEVLKEHKKGLLQNLFPKSRLNHDSSDEMMSMIGAKKNQVNQENQKNQGSDNVPKLRFKEFEERWEKVKLKDVSLYFNGCSYENDVKEEGKYELITLKSINTNGQLVSSKRYLDIEVPTLSKGTLVMILSEQAPGLLGMTAIIPVDNKYILNQRVAEIRPNQKVENYFLSMAINRNQIYFSKHGAGTKVQNISKPNVENYEFLLPEIQEQKKIASALSSIDDLIIAQGQKIEALQLHKKGLLQGLFPQLSEP